MTDQDPSNPTPGAAAPPPPPSASDLKAQLRVAKAAERAGQSWVRRHPVLLIVGIVGLVVVLGFVGLIALVVATDGTGTAKPDYDELAKVDAAEFKAVDTAAWAAIRKDPEAAKGKRITVYAQVSQFDSATGTETFLAGVGTYQPTTDYEFEMDTMFRGTADVLNDIKQDDTVRIEGQVAGVLEYDTAIGGSNTVPLIDIARIENVGFADLKKDVKVGKLVSGEFGEASVELTVTNSAAKPMTYNIQLSARAGDKSVGEAYADTPKIEPGESVKIDATGFYDVPAHAKIQLAKVERWPS